MVGTLVANNLLLTAHHAKHDCQKHGSLALGHVIRPLECRSLQIERWVGYCALSFVAIIVANNRTTVQPNTSAFATVNFSVVVSQQLSSEVDVWIDKRAV